MFLLPLMVFSGFFINIDSIPVWFSWIQYLSPMRYGFVALAQNELDGLPIKCEPGQNCLAGITGGWRCCGTGGGAQAGTMCMCVSCTGCAML
jgi:hypothetical protein